MHFFVAYFPVMPNSDTCGGAIVMVLVVVVIPVVILVTIVG